MFMQSSLTLEHRLGVVETKIRETSKIAINSYGGLLYKTNRVDAMYLQANTLVVQPLLKRWFDPSII
jgi:hypothetical protein